MILFSCVIAALPTINNLTIKRFCFVAISICRTSRCCDSITAEGARGCDAINVIRSGLKVGQPQE